MSKNKQMNEYFTNCVLYCRSLATVPMLQLSSLVTENQGHVYDYIEDYRHKPLTRYTVTQCPAYITKTQGQRSEVDAESEYDEVMDAESEGEMQDQRSEVKAESDIVEYYDPVVV